LIVGASSVGINGNAQVGKSYVVFGKINSTAINLSSTPLTSPAVETEEPFFSPLIEKPPVPAAMLDKLMAVELILPNTT
jgi:hypothetical protein